MTPLITAAEVITLAFQDKNILSARVKDVFIEMAHIAHLRAWLGDDLYDALVAATPTGDNKTLVDTYLKKPLAFYTKYYMLPEMFVNVNNSGMQLAQPQGTIAATDKQAGLLREQCLDIADNLMRDAIRYIDDNPEKFTSYSSTEEPTRKTTKVIGGVVFMLALLITFSGCVTQKRCAERFPCTGETKDSIVYKTSYRDTVIYVPIPGQNLHNDQPVSTAMEERYRALIDSFYRAVTHRPGTYIQTVNSDTSHLKTTFADSYAWINQGRLYHQLFQKDTAIKDTIHKAIRETETFWKQREKVVVKENYLTGFQWFQVWGFRIMAGFCLLIGLFILFKSQITKFLP